MTVLPDNILRCLSPTDRKSLGKAGMTAEEALRKMEVKNEGVLQKQIVGLLRLRGIEPIVSHFGKKTRNNLGTPDIIFAAFGIPCAWELKMPKTGRTSDGQTDMAVRLSTPPNSWRHRIIKSVDEAIAELKEIEAA